MGKRQDLTGIRFGKLKVVKFLGVFPGNGGKACSWWECECNCPDHTHVSVVATDLLTGRKRDCGCVAEEARHKRFVDDLTGMTFGRFTVIDHTKKPGNIKHRGAYWKCKCNTCGFVTIVRSDRVKDGSLDLCPVCDKETFNHVHNNQKSIKVRLRNIWNAMNHRCSNPSDKNYKHYGGRGISVCYRWSKDNPDGWKNFREDAYKNGYHDQPVGTRNGDLLSIERMDVNGDYCPENCAWIKKKYQVRNTRRSKHIVDADGKTKLFKDFIIEHDVQLYYYLSKGWSLNAIVFKVNNPDRNIVKTENGYMEIIAGHTFYVLIPEYGNKD